MDALSISGHKLGAPKGSGALFVRGRVRLEPLVHGGGQERGRRSGTENVAGAVALATALTLPREPAGRVAALRDGFIDAVLAGVPGALLTGHPTERLPSVASFCFPGTSGESVLLELERQGIICSSGSACAAGSDAPVARAAGHGHRARGRPDGGAVQLRLDRDRGELQEAAAAVRTAVGSVRSLGTLHRLSRHYMSYRASIAA